MKSLKNFFVVDELELSLLAQDKPRVEFVRIVIKAIKRVQLEKKRVANNREIMQILHQLAKEQPVHKKLANYYIELFSDQQ